MRKTLLVATLAYIVVEGETETDIAQTVQQLQGKFIVMNNPNVCGNSDKAKVIRLEFAFSRIHDASTEYDGPVPKDTK